MPGKMLISVEELSEQLGISLTVAYRLSRQADFPTVRIGRRRLVDVESLQKWIKARSGLSQEER